MGNKVYPVKIINKTFPITVADAVKIQGSNKNIINYVDETVNSLREYCNNDLQEGIKNYLRDIEKIDVVKDLGVIPEKQDEATRANNASLIKSKICESKRNFEGGIVLFFPSGTYHIDPIEFNEEFTDASLTVFLVGENKGFNNYNILCNKGVKIYTYGNFMVRTNTEGNNTATFNASDLRFQQNNVSVLSTTAPHGILFGATTNLGYEYNFHIYNCDIVGYEKALYSPGFSCGGTRVINSYFGLCKYGILIMSACHTLSMDNVAFNVCYRGLTLLLGGDYCEIRHIHFDTSFHISYQAFLEEDSRCYGIYTTGGLAIDGIYTEQYNSQYNSGDNFIETPTTYTVIDYEGNNYSCGGKLLLKNASIGAPAASCKTFFRGANFQGPGLLKIDGSSITSSTPIRITHEMGLWQKGSVDFVRCNYSMQVLKESMDIYGGNDRAAGYVFDYRDVYGDGVAFTMHPIRGYKGSLIYNPDYILDHPKYIPTSINDYTERGAMFYNHRHYDPKVLTYKGCRLPSVDTLIHESTGDNTCHVKGNIYVNNIDNENVDVDVFIYFLPVIANSPFTKLKRIKLFSLNSSTINTEFTIPIDYTVSSLEYRGFMFGYEVKKDETFSTLTESEQMNYVLEKMLQVEDEKKIIYDYEYVWNEYGIVKRLDVQQIELSSSSLTLDDTTPTQQLTVTYYPTQTTQKGVEWTSSNEEVATVDTDGNVTKVAAGDCVITATCNNTDYAHSATCDVTVSQQQPPSNVQIVDIYGGNTWEPHEFRFKEGYKYELTPVTDCTFNNLSEVTTIDAIAQETPQSLKGHYKIKTLKDENEVNPPVNFVRTSAAILYPLVTKISGLNDIIFLGDSLTDANFSAQYGNYVKYLFDKYNSRYNFATQLATYGHTTDQQITVLDKYVGMFAGNASGYFDITPGNDNVKIVSIFTGTNEIDKDVDVSTFETNYTNIINKVKENFTNAKIICITPFLCCKKSTNINYINKVKEIATANNCVICDLSTFTQLDSVSNGKNEYYLEDECLHLTPAGWELVNPTIETAFINAGI